jgi:hypothetical protein
VRTSNDKSCRDKRPCTVVSELVVAKSSVDVVVDDDDDDDAAMDKRFKVGWRREADPIQARAPFRHMHTASSTMMVTNADDDNGNLDIQLLSLRTIVTLSVNALGNY